MFDDLYEGINIMVSAKYLLALPLPMNPIASSAMLGMSHHPSQGSYGRSRVSICGKRVDIDSLPS